ncbi:type II secretion system secretin GspD [Hyphomonas sp. FCG-A18]|uniref:type II secretion system secretin GspD n=1 Tax=Hyphomonas sp. FCG-A18 TaxID=3080019 RepID=UPI002B2F25EC|nr:type II secretion system secretin GspD [Hyphomonas sp. FCG-A18]
MKRVFLGTAAAMVLATPIATAEMNSPQASRHVLNLNDVEVTALIDDVSIITGYTFILHPDVRRTKVTVMSQAAMTTDEVFQVFLSTLRVNGFTAVPAGRGVYRILPEQMAIGEASLNASGANIFRTEVIRLNNFSAIEAAQMVKPLVDAQGQVIANARSNTLVVVDYASNMPRLREVVAGLDSSDRTKMETIALRNVPAVEMEGILSNLMSTREDGARTNFEVSASKSSNSIVVRGDELNVAQAIRVATELDETDPIQDSLRVIALKNSTAEDIVPILEKLSESMAAKSGPADDVSRQATIAHHEATNSLVISAPPESLLAMERVVDELDRRRAQVLVEAIIVEVSDDTARELGVEFLLSGTGESQIPFLSTSFSRSAPNLLALGGALIDPDVFGGTNPFTTPAVNSLLGLDGATVGGVGQSGDTLFGAVLTAVEKDTDSRILSKPFNMTLDNGTSELLVGQEVSIATGSVLSSDNSNPFQTVERQKVGVTLRVTPSISEDDTVQLDIYQEVSNIAGVVGEDATNPIFNKREITTQVLADNGEIIVLGGLIEQEDTVVNSKVPILGDIPVVGNLFKSEGKGQNRSNLMVFIKPTIVRNREEARSVTNRNYRYIRAEEMLRDADNGSSSLDTFIEEVLGDKPPMEE